MYGWFVFVHLVGLVVFSVAHGVSVFAAFRARRERDQPVVATLLDLSKTATGGLYIGLVLLGIGGLGAAWQGNLLLAPWIVASYITLAVVLIVMWSVATPYYVKVRELAEDPVAASDGRLRQALDSRRPEVLLIVGGIGLLVLVWLMVLKPA